MRYRADRHRTNAPNNSLERRHPRGRDGDGLVPREGVAIAENTAPTMRSAGRRGDLYIGFQVTVVQGGEGNQGCGERRPEVVTVGRP